MFTKLMAKPQTIGSLIRDRRKLLGLTQAQLGEAVGLTRQAIIAYERGGADPSGQTIMSIAAALGLSPGDLFPPTDPASD